MWTLKNKQTKKSLIIDAENRLLVARIGGWGVGNMGKWGQMYKFPVLKYINHGDVTYSVVTIVNNTTVHI